MFAVFSAVLTIFCVSCAGCIALIQHEDSLSQERDAERFINARSEFLLCIEAEKIAMPAQQLPGGQQLSDNARAKRTAAGKNLTKIENEIWHKYNRNADELAFRYFEKYPWKKK